MKQIKPTYQLHIRVNENIATKMDEIKAKHNMSYNAIVMAALVDYIKKC